MLYQIKKLIPKSFFKKMQPVYHWSLTALAALVFGFPSAKIKVIGVTGTKGKTTTTELISAIMEEAGYRTAVISTLHFKIGSNVERNLLKMSMPGRFVLQRLLARAVRSDCNYAIVEMTSEGAKLYRHNFIFLDALVFTNISPEHIESHGSYDKYLAAKLRFARALANSPKKNKVIVANGDDKETAKFLAFNISQKITFHLEDASPYLIKDEGLEITFDSQKIVSRLSGQFNIYNMLGAIKLTQALGVKTETIKRALEKFNYVPGRMEPVKIDDPKQNFDVIVDYAHTADSLEKVYEVFKNRRIIAVFGATGGGRDKWKRTEMGKVADKYCAEIILTDDDSYDEDPAQICREVAEGIAEHKPEIITDRRLAIRSALKKAREGDVVILSGKGTDPYLMGPNNKKTPWSDSGVAREELISLLTA